MTRYAAFLRGVSPMNLKMPQLRRARLAAGFGDVRTLLSSGNVVFSGRRASEATIAATVTAAVEKEVGRSFGTIVRTLADLQSFLDAVYLAQKRTFLLGLDTRLEKSLESTTLTVTSMSVVDTPALVRPLGSVASAPRRSGVLERFRALSPRAQAAVLTLLSFAVWEAWEGLREFRHPWGDLSGETYTDHFSHMNAARVFPVIGTAIWRQGYDSMFRKLTPDEVKRLPADVAKGGSYSGNMFSVPGWPADKPLVSSWSNNPRNYPPGDMLLVAPIAAAYAHTDLSFMTANRLLLMLFILYAHLAIFWIFQTAFEAAASLDRSQRRQKWLTALVAGIVYLEVIHWTLEGFYDAAALAPLVLCARFLRDRRGLPALGAYCVAAFIHFRTYFFAPLAIYGLVLVIRERQWVRWRSGAIMALVGAAVVGAISLTVFAILWPSFQHLPLHSPIAGSIPWLDQLLRAGFLLSAAVVGRILYRSRAWWDLALLGWLTVMSMCLHERYPWHTELAILPWLAAPIFPHAPNTTGNVLLGRCAVFVAAVCCLFGAEPFAVWHLWSV